MSEQGDAVIPERVTISISTAELQAVGEFSDGNQDARRWWTRIELAMTKLEDHNDYGKMFIKLVDVKLCGEAARWADDTPEIAEILECKSPGEEQIATFKKLFLARFKKVKPLAEDIDRALEELKQKPGEDLEDYYNRARKILILVCEDGTTGKVARSPIPKAEAQWIKSVIKGFSKGMLDQWIGFHIADEDNMSLENAYKSAKEHIRKIKRHQERSLEWEKEGFEAPGYTSNAGGAYGTYASYEKSKLNQDANANKPKPPPDVRPPFPQQNRYGQGPSGGNNYVGQRAIGYQPPKALPPAGTTMPHNSDMKGQQTYGPTNFRSPNTSHPSNSGPWMPPRQNNGTQSKNPYVNGTTIFQKNGGQPLCVSCGELGHISKVCNAKPLEAWEREHLKSLVFPESYQNSRSARLFRGGIPMSESEDKEEDTKYYLLAGYDVDDTNDEDKIASRISHLSIDDIHERKLSSRSSKGEKGDPFAQPYRKVRIDDLLNKRKERSDASSTEQPMRKRPQVSGVPTGVPFKKDDAGSNRRKAIPKTRKGTRKVADMTNEEKLEREKKKNQKRQLKMIKGMINQERFDLAKALAQTPCPISYLQYFQDSPHARLEMSRINSLTSEMLAAMFGDPAPAARSGEVRNEDDSYNELPLSRPHLGDNGAFMVSAHIKGIKEGDPGFDTTRVCIDAGSEVDLATPLTIKKTNGDVIDIKDTPWPNLSIRTSSGESVRLLAIARIRVIIRGVDRVVYTCVIPEKCAKNTGYDLLLGVPWLYGVKGSINVAEGNISVYDGTNKKVLINTGIITPPNFKVMFETCGVDNVPLSDSETSSEEYESDDEEDTGEESDKTSDDGPSTLANKLLSRCAQLIIEKDLDNMSRPKEIAKLRYVTPKDYLSLYGNKGPYSHLAKAASEFSPQMEDENGNHIDDNETMMILDHENKYQSTQENTPQSFSGNITPEGSLEVSPSQRFEYEKWMTLKGF